MPLIVDTDSADNSSRSTSKETKSTSVATPTLAIADFKNVSGINAILEAIKTKERKKHTVTEAPPASAVPNTSSNAVHDVADDDSTIPSTIDIQMKEESSDIKNGYGFSWRQDPSESFSDWTIEVLDEDITEPHNGECAVYHVHRRVLAVGLKKSDYFANIFKLNGSANRNQLRLSKRQTAVFPLVLDYIYADIDFDLDPEKAYAVSFYISSSFGTMIGTQNCW